MESIKQFHHHGRVSFFFFTFPLRKQNLHPWSSTSLKLKLKVQSLRLWSHIHLKYVVVEYTASTTKITACDYTF